MHKKFVVYGEWERYIKAVEARLSDGAKLDKEDDLPSHCVDTVTTPSVALGKRKEREDFGVGKPKLVRHLLKNLLNSATIALSLVMITLRHSTFTRKGNFIIYTLRLKGRRFLTHSESSRCLKLGLCFKQTSY
jgi:hypothetical protein